MSTFQRKACRSLRKKELNCETDKKLGEDLHLKGAERICKYKCSKVNALRKWRSGSSRQEETRLKFSQAREKVKAILAIRTKSHAFYAARQNIYLLKRQKAEPCDNLLYSSEEFSEPNPELSYYICQIKNKYKFGKQMLYLEGLLQGRMRLLQ